MRRREFITLLGGAAIAWPCAAGAQQRERMRRIGVLLVSVEGDKLSQANFATLRTALDELGWKEGRNAKFEVRYVGGRPDRASEAVAELIQAEAEIIVTGTTQLVQAAMNTPGKIPVVMTGIGDPVGAKVVASLARPGGHVTGFSLIAPDLAGKRLELTRETLPGLARVAIIWNPNNASVALRFKETQSAARMLGLMIESVPVQHPADFEPGLQAAMRAGAQALMTTEDALLLSQRAQLVRLATQYRLPAISGLRYFSEVGALLSYGPSIRDIWRRAASTVDKIFKGTDPAELPVEQPTRFELVINLKTAKALGLEIPPMVLARAAEVIE